MTDDKDKVRLLPCANCGGRAALSTYKKRIGSACPYLVIRQHVVCKVCGTQTRVFKALGKAAAAWNKRQPTQSEVLREALEGWRTIYQLAPPHPDIAPDIWQDMIDRTAAALAALDQSK